MIADLIFYYLLGLVIYCVCLLFIGLAATTGRGERDTAFVASFAFVWPVGVLVGMWLISYRLFKYGRS